MKQKLEAEKSTTFYHNDRPKYIEWIKENANVVPIHLINIYDMHNPKIEIKSFENITDQNESGSLKFTEKSYKILKVARILNHIEKFKINDEIFCIIATENRATAKTLCTLIDKPLAEFEGNIIVIEYEKLIDLLKEYNEFKDNPKLIEKISEKYTRFFDILSEPIKFPAGKEEELEPDESEQEEPEEEETTEESEQEESEQEESEKEEPEEEKPEQKSKEELEKLKNEEAEMQAIKAKIENLKNTYKKLLIKAADDKIKNTKLKEYYTIILDKIEEAENIKKEAAKIEKAFDKKENSMKTEFIEKIEDLQENKKKLEEEYNKKEEISKKRNDLEGRVAELKQKNEQAKQRLTCAKEEAAKLKKEVEEKTKK